MVGLESLDDDICGVEMPTSDTTDDLGEKMKGAFFGGEIGERKSGIGLYNSNGSEFWQVETFGERLCANEDIDVARFDGVEIGFKRIFFSAICVKTSNFGVWEEAF